MALCLMPRRHPRRLRPARRQLAAAACATIPFLCGNSARLQPTPTKGRDSQRRLQTGAGDGDPIAAVRRTRRARRRRPSALFPGGGARGVPVGERSGLSAEALKRRLGAVSFAVGLVRTALGPAGAKSAIGAFAATVLYPRRRSRTLAPLGDAGKTAAPPRSARRRPSDPLGRQASLAFSAFKPAAKMPLATASTYLPASSGRSSNSADHSTKAPPPSVTGLTRMCDT